MGDRDPFLDGIMSRRDLPPAYGNCQCACHRVPGIIHVTACCHPSDDEAPLEYDTPVAPPEGTETAPRVSDELTGGADLSDDGVYRYLLWRRWDVTKPRAVFIMLNPSTADASVDDPTIRRCIGFAKAWGMGGIRVVNLYPFRATKPADLWRAAHPRGMGNLGYIERAIDHEGIVIAAWGAHGKEAQVKEVAGLFYDLGVPLYALKVTKDGVPGHPLYIAAATAPVVYAASRQALTKGTAWRGLKVPA